MTDDLVFEVKRDPDGTIVLIPDFWPSNLTATDQGFYDALRRNHRARDGAIVCPKYARGGVSVGEQVTLDELRGELMDSFSDAVETLRDVLTTGGSGDYPPSP